ncbi:MAG TPA: hypothetical protein VGR69_05305 [Candidatus Rubrimentiphilum sp.]|nr:hypothetical protein [Candidatus Rubrimentiphilum sp.]
MQVDPFIRWFYVAIFTGFGVFMLLWPKKDLIVNIPAYFKRMNLDDRDKDRLIAVAERRKALERGSPAWARAAGVLNLVSAVAVALKAVPIPVAYSLMLVGFVTLIGAAYFRMRNTGPRRVASLDVRTPFKVLPLYGYVAATIGSMLPLVDVPNPSLRLVAIIVTMSSLAITFFAWRIAGVPALIAGDDIPVEIFVDDYLRLIRATGNLLLAPAAAFVYFSLTAEHANTVHLIAQLVSVACFLVVDVLLLAVSRKSVTPQELDRWQQV